MQSTILDSNFKNIRTADPHLGQPLSLTGAISESSWSPENRWSIRGSGEEENENEREKEKGSNCRDSVDPCRGFEIINY